MVAAEGRRRARPGPHGRLLRWQQRAVFDRLADAKPGPDVPLHPLDWERAAIVKLAEGWAEVDRSHRKLAHCGSRLEPVCRALNSCVK